ncbi:DNA cytosine methyltransferase [Paenibacillus sp. FSL R7-0048]|uniref:DNA cytosine methyltransferase n=1 Tax=Paenibacillus TaxID=44249 RepID=UPI00096F8F2A|nr:DNA cytosine methyltransferase [Paenibacillus odorifer]OMD73334.1 hypothetical protein BSK48_05585 [Paenibacillus odorifer]
MKKLSLFSGIGGIDLAAEWAGMQTIAFCEREPFPQKVLKKHWPDVPIYDDVCTLTKARLEADGIDTRAIGLISAGYPCQPFSNAGKREGENDNRHLWPEVKRLLEEIRPRWFIGENVAGHVTLGLDDVLSDLGDIGYAAQPIVIPAAAVGAPHRRDRVFIVGYTERGGCGGEPRGRAEQEPPNGYCKLEERVMVNSSSPGLSKWRQPEWNESQQEAGTGLESESERSGENVADTNCIRNNSSGECGIDCNRQEELQKREQSQRGFGYFGQNVADSSSSRQQECNITSISDGERHGSRGINEKRTIRSIESELGRVLDGVSRRLDGHRWPAGQGAEQSDWEPPRVATGVKNRVGRLKGLGNAVVPWQIYPIVAAIKAIDDSLGR